MGYRSDIRIVVSKEGYEKLKEFSDNYIAENNKESEISFENLLKNCDVFKMDDKQCYIGWDSVKWYDGFPDVDAIEKGLDYLKENDYSYRISIIGENMDDIEERSHDSEQREEDIWLEYPSIIRGFDDEYVMEQIKDVSTDEKEQENKEEVDI